MRKRRFGFDGEDGSSVPADDELTAANNSSDSQEIAGEAMLKGMRDSASEAKAAPAKPRVVSKAELDKSGMTLRDYLNKEQGLTRRRDTAAPASKATPAAAKAAPAAPAKSTPASEPKSSTSGIPGSSPEGWTGGKGEKIDSTELGRNVSNTMNALSGPASGLAAVNRAKQAAQGASKVGSRALATAESPVTFLGKSGARQVSGGPEISSAARQAITNNPTKQLAGPPKQLPGPKGGGTVTDVAEKATRTSKVAEKGREAVTNPMEWAMGPKHSSMSRKTPSKGKKPPEADTTGGAIGYKKGGNVKGWGMARGARAAKMR